MSVIYDDIKQGKRADMAKFGAAVHDLKKAGLRHGRAGLHRVEPR